MLFEYIFDDVPEAEEREHANHESISDADFVNLRKQLEVDMLAKRHARLQLSLPSNTFPSPSSSSFKLE